MKASIPKLNSGNQAVDRFAEAVKQNLDGITGQLKNSPKIAVLAPTATAAECAAKINEIIARLQS